MEQKSKWKQLNEGFPEQKFKESIMCLNKLIDKTSNEIKLQIKNVATCKNTSIYIPFKKVQIFACIIL